MASIPAFAWRSSPCSIFPYASEARVETVESRNWPTSIWRSASARSSIVGSRPSSANPLTCLHLLSVDLRERSPLLEPRALALGGVQRRHREVRGGADLVGDGSDPVDELLQPCPSRYRLAALEV